jgi:hypothetical protein
LLGFPVLLSLSAIPGTLRDQRWYTSGPKITAFLTGVKNGEFDDLRPRSGNSVTF